MLPGAAIHEISSGLLPKLCVGEERPYNEQDFASHLPRSHASLLTCLDLFKEQELILDVSVVTPVILLCGEHTEASRPWTQGKHVQLAYQVLAGLKTRTSRDSLSCVLLDDDSKLLRPVFIFVHLYL